MCFKYIHFREFVKATMPKPLWKCLSWGKRQFLTLPFYIFRIFPIKNNKIILSNSFDGGFGFGDNPKYVALELLKQNINYDIVWAVKDISNIANEGFPSGIRFVKKDSLKAKFEYATAKVWIENHLMSIYYKKRKSQYYINTWHGLIPLKRILGDDPTISPSGKKYIAETSTLIDLMISSSKFRSQNYRQAFFYNGEILECGCPKSEQMLIKDESIKPRICKQFGIDSQTRIAMYAPTFRGKYQELENDFSYKFDYLRIKHALEKRFGGKWSIIKRFHPNISRARIAENDGIIDVSNYPDMQDFLRICDVLITDYSGTQFELLYDTSKICFLYAIDRTSYDRGYYFNFDQLPYTFANNTDELESHIANFDDEKYKQKVKDFKQKVGLVEEFGASKITAQRIADVVSGKFQKISESRSVE